MAGLVPTAHQLLPCVPPPCPPVCIINCYPVSPLVAPLYTTGTSSTARPAPNAPPSVLQMGILQDGMSPQQRQRIMQRFASGELRALAVPDVVARGLDLPGVDLVVCWGPPQDAVNYAHRWV